MTSAPRPESDGSDLATVLPAEYSKAISRREHRPETWDDLVGNTAARDILTEAIVAAQRSGSVVPHTILYGPSGMGKTSIAEILARSIGGGFVKSTASTLETPMDMLRLIHEVWEAGNDLNERPVVLFLDEIHALGQAKGRQSIDVESVYPLLEDWVFYHNLQGKSFTWRDCEVTPRSGAYHVFPFTLVGATTDPGLLPMAMLRRFPLQIELVQYTDDEIAEIIMRSAARQGWAIEPGAPDLLASFCRKTPGTAQVLLTQCRQRAEYLEIPITVEVVEFIIRRLRLHRLGLTENDVSALQVLARRPKGVGAAEIARAIGVAPSTFTNMQEPYLRMLGLIETLSRRVLTDAGRSYLASIGRA